MSYFDQKTSKNGKNRQKMRFYIMIKKTLKSDIFNKSVKIRHFIKNTVF